MLYLDAAALRESLSMKEAIEAMRWAFSAETQVPLRSRVGPSLVMPGVVDGVMAVKVVSVVPGNPTGLVVVFDQDGSPIGMVDGHTLTSIRTGAVTGLATDLLAVHNASTLAMLGAGEMAADMIAAVRAVRPIERVLVWSRNLENAARLGGLADGEPAKTVEEAVEVAAVVSCATPAKTPLFDSDVVNEGAHVNAVGAFTPEMAELSPMLLERAYVVVDDREAAAAEAGDLIQARP